LLTDEFDAYPGILKSHVQLGVDHYKVFLSAELPAALGGQIPEIDWAFARAAAWPDWVRMPKAPGLGNAQAREIKTHFHKGPWHFVNLPYIHPAEADRFDAPALTKAVVEPEFDDANDPQNPRHAIAALKQALAVLRSANAKNADKAVKLCWLLHLVGDLHQPLHCAALISKAQFPPETFAPPGGDEGGNRLAVKLKPTDKNAVKLHAFWDALVFKDTQDFAQVERMVTQLLKDPKCQPDQLPELARAEFIDWANESLALAKASAYTVNGDKDGTFLKATPLPATHDETVLLGLDAPALSSQYQTAATEVAKRRIVVAGYRLARQVKLALQVEK